MSPRLSEVMYLTLESFRDVHRWLAKALVLVQLTMLLSADATVGPLGCDGASPTRNQASRSNRRGGGSVMRVDRSGLRDPVRVRSPESDALYAPHAAICPFALHA